MAAPERIHLAGPTPAEEAREVLARGRRYLVHRLAELVADARALHASSLLLKGTGRAGQARLDRIRARDVLAQARTIREKLLGAWYA